MTRQSTGSVTRQSTGSGNGVRRVVVVGSGVAGLTAALHARDAGAAVTVVTKADATESNTRYAQGGIAAALWADDSTAAHAADTMAAAAGLADAAAVDVLVTEGPERVRELIGLGAQFDRSAGGELVRGLEAAHSARRIVHAGGDATGAEIERALLDAVRRAGIEILEHAFLADLVCDAGVVRGVDLLVGDEEEPLRLAAEAVVLATGGAGMLYPVTTNPPIATGDGIAAALRAGARVADLEFVQFHPTVVAVGEPFLVSEAVRGEGAALRAADGRRFAFDAHPDGELAPRDVVARAIASQATRQGAPVVLDATGLFDTDPDTRRARLAARFPTIAAATAARGIDWANEPVPVTPAAHYLMGGVVTDVDGRSSVPGLYAAGESARSGVHGANRLASNSLLDGAVFGARAGRAAATDATWPHPARPDAPRQVPVRPAPATPFTRDALQALMWREAGLSRHAAGLDAAAATIAAWRAQPAAAGDVHAREDANLLLVAAHLVDAAAARPTSIGAHHRSDDGPDGGDAAITETAAHAAGIRRPTTAASRGARTREGARA